MSSLSTHVLDAAGGGPFPNVAVTVFDEEGKVVASATTGADGRVAPLADGLAPGRYTIAWDTRGPFVRSVAATVDLAEERHYHVPLLASPVAAVVYLGA